MGSIVQIIDQVEKRMYFCFHCGSALLCIDGSSHKRCEACKWMIAETLLALVTAGSVSVLVSAGD